MWLFWPRLPFWLARRKIEWQTQRALNSPAAMDAARLQMQHLLGAVGRTGDVTDAARAHIVFWIKCDELRWHPRKLTRQRVEGLENLLAAHRLGSGVVLSFVHHAHYVGAFGSIAREGLPIKVVAASAASRKPFFIQHMHVVKKGGGLLPVTRGTAGIVEELKRGGVVAVATDIPGGSEVTFAGRRVKCSSGAAHAAVRAEAPVVVMTSHRDGDGVVIRLSEPIPPDPARNAPEILSEIVRQHERAVLQWPEAASNPLFAWSPVATEP